VVWNFHDPAPGANVEEGREAGAGSGAGLIDFDGIGCLRELR
jgi:hypothetical protein